jgi:hypothetical protein
MHILHSIISFQNHKDNEQDDKIGNLYYNMVLIILRITRPKDPYAGHLCYNKWHKI